MARVAEGHGHVGPYAAGGQAVAANIELRCRAHNQYEADLFVRGPAPPVVREDPSVYGAGNSVRTEWHARNHPTSDAQARGGSVSYPAGRVSCDILVGDAKPCS